MREEGFRIGNLLPAFYAAKVIEFRRQKYYNTYHMRNCQEIWPLKKYIDK